MNDIYYEKQKVLNMVLPFIDFKKKMSSQSNKSVIHIGVNLKNKYELNVII